MTLSPSEADARAVGDFEPLLAQLESPAEALVADGYATLMERVASPEYRRSCGLRIH